MSKPPYETVVKLANTLEAVKLVVEMGSLFDKGEETLETIKSRFPYLALAFNLEDEAHLNPIWAPWALTHPKHGEKAGRYERIYSALLAQKLGNNRERPWAGIFFARGQTYSPVGVRMIGEGEESDCFIMVCFDVKEGDSYSYIIRHSEDYSLVGEPVETSLAEQDSDLGSTLVRAVKDAWAPTEGHNW